MQVRLIAVSEIICNYKYNPDSKKVLLLNDAYFNVIFITNINFSHLCFTGM